jgi:hypothetical protein
VNDAREETMTDSTQQRTTNDRSESIGGVAVIDIWTFEVRPTPGQTGTETEKTPNVTGFSVEATDGKIGKVDEATYQAGGSFLIVDTGPWIFGKKVMLPAGVVERINPENKTLFVNLTKDQLKNAPDFDEETGRDDQDYRRRLGDYYSQR